MEKLVCSAAEFAADIENTLKDGGCVALVVTGNSMNPFLCDGRDRVWIRAFTDADLKKGRILLFRRNDGTLVLHRVRKILNRSEFVMNGDAQVWCEKINAEQIIAAVGETESNGKRIACSSAAYKIKIAVWQLLMPLRPFLMRAWRKFGKK